MVIMPYNMNDPIDDRDVECGKACPKCKNEDMFYSHKTDKYICTWCWTKSDQEDAETSWLKKHDE